MRTHRSFLVNLDHVSCSSDRVRDRDLGQHLLADAGLAQDQHVDVGVRGALASRYTRRISGPQRMSSDDGVTDTLRPCTRSHARAIRPSAERASAGKNAMPVRAAMPR